MIPTHPSPKLSDPTAWSPIFADFLAHCLVKDPERRATAAQLLEVC
jgi:serine/threonine-protein kinase 24/25/MST4